MALYIRRPVTHEIVEAEQMVAGAQFHPQGTRPPKPGEWVVTNLTTGASETMPPEEFNAMFEPLNVPGNLIQVPGAADLAAAQAGPLPGVETQTIQPELPAAAPIPGPAGATEVFTPMNEAVPGRPVPTPDTKPHMGDPAGPVVSPSGQIEPVTSTESMLSPVPPGSTGFVQAEPAPGDVQLPNEPRRNPDGTLPIEPAHDPAPLI